MGRARQRTDEENKTFDKEYQKLYREYRRNVDGEYYKASQKRSYYRRLLRNMSPENTKYEKYSQKVRELDEQVNAFLGSRQRYGRLDLCKKVSENLATA